MAVEMKPTPVLKGAASARFKEIIRANSTKSCTLVATPESDAFVRRILRDQQRGK
ncbi:hypothetical protein [Victivallis vadensis]|uniref:hypothetical protein n=1 Tax=Victivallis vadensis TaxID=172901 RepID=UPI0023F0E58E|nr:hypothetical protein [Victivallis vadensis]